MHDATHHSDHRPSHRTPDSPNDLQESLHQAVDIGFAVADLIGGLFGFKDEADRLKARHILHSRADGSSDVFIALDSNSQPYLTCTGPSQSQAVVITVTTQDQASPPTPMLGQISSQVIYVPGGGAPTTFTDFPNYTQGMMTVTQIPDTSTISPGNPVAAATLRSFSTNPAVDAGPQTILLQGTAQSPELTATIESGQIVFANNGPSNYLFAATVTTAKPTQIFTLYAAPVAGSTAAVPFPDSAGTAVLQDISIVVTAS